MIQEPKLLPNFPGVYFFYNAEQRIIYVGKAKNLKKRVSQYFQKNKQSLKNQKMIAQIISIDYVVLNSESEALLLECDLIKKYRPRYNVLLRDDKTYPYLTLNQTHAFPRLQIYRGMRTDPQLTYYGPYANPGTLKKNLILLQQLFQLRQCSDHDFKTRTRPCLQYQIKCCAAPCVNYISEVAYQKLVAALQTYLAGDPKAVIDDFIEKMQIASQNLQYEQAAIYRNNVQKLRNLHATTYPVPSDKAFDIMALQFDTMCDGVFCFSFRKGHCLNGQFFKLSHVDRSNPKAILTQFILHYYTKIVRSDWPKRVIVPQDVQDKSVLEKSLKQRLSQKIQFSTRLNDALQVWYDLAKANAKRAANKATVNLPYLEKFLVLEEQLKHKFTIQRMECFDISHTQGSETVGACVVFDAHGPNKSEYRIFNIKDITPGDDYAAIYQAVYRRYRRILVTKSILPDVIIIDGGVGQLKQAVLALTTLAIDLAFMTVIAVAKGVSRKLGWETLYRNGDSVPMALSSDSKAFILIQNIRDEAHRFAILKHRRRQRKRFLESPLSNISGVGPAKRKALLAYFGGLKPIKTASYYELAKVPGISHNLAKVIFQHFKIDPL